MFKSRMIILLLLVILTSKAYASSPVCGGYDCLSETDKVALNNARSDVSYLIPTFQNCARDINQIAPGDFSNAAYVHKRFAKVTYEMANALKKAHGKTVNPELKSFYSVFGNNFSELGDLLTAGAAICDAKSRNSTQIATGMLEGLVTGEAKSLVSPIVSMYDLNNRISEFADLYNRRFLTMSKSNDIAEKRLYKKLGIRF